MGALEILFYYYYTAGEEKLANTDADRAWERTNIYTGRKKDEEKKQQQQQQQQQQNRY